MTLIARAGLSDVIGLDWLRMFSSKELSTLISGAEHEINVADLQVSQSLITGSSFLTLISIYISNVP